MAFVEPVDRVQLLDHAFVEHRHAVAHGERFALVVRHVDEGHAELAVQVLELELHVLAQLLVERAERLVHQHQLRLEHQRARQRHAKARELIAKVQLDAFADRLPAQLSGGQQQRIALARALVFKPQLVLMDEPLGALDKQLREHMQLELKALHRQLGVTFVYVTHDQGEALTMSDRVAVFNEGVIQQLDTLSLIHI